MARVPVPLPDGVLAGRLDAGPEPKAFRRELERGSTFRSPVSGGTVALDDFSGPPLHPACVADEVASARRPGAAYLFARRFAAMPPE